MSDEALYWESSYEIVQALESLYAEMDVDSVGMEALYRMIVDLPNFVDDPLMVNEGILSDILREWYEERNA